MKISAFKARNWLVHHHLEQAFRPLTIVCGPNGAGKSSIADGIAFAMMGELRRIDQKSDRDRLITEGQSDGEVSLTCEDVTITRAIATGKLTQAGALPMVEDAVKTAVPYLLDASRFARASVDQRRELLFHLLSVAIDDATLKAELLTRGHPEALVKVLTGPSANWEALCGKKASEERGAWRQIAGEAYGSQKAETWAPPRAPQIDPEENSNLRRSVAALTERIAALERQAGAGQANARIRQQHEAQIAALRDRAAQEADLTQQLAKAETEAFQAKRAHDDATAALADQSQRQGPTTPDLECPYCMRTVALHGTRLVAGDSALLRTPAKPTVTPAAATRLGDALKAANDRVRLLGQAVAEARGARVMIDTLTAGLAELGTEEGSADVADALQAAKDDLREATERLARRERQEREYQETIERAAKAQAAHEAVKGWTKLEAATSPGGLMAELVAKGLEPLIATLRRFADDTRWPQVTIDSAMTIRAGGRPYGLLCESEQWRVDAMLTVATAMFAKLGFVLLDRMDVLDLPGRMTAVKWLYRLTRDGLLDTALVFATMKERPRVPAAVGVYWLGEPERAAA